MQLLYRTHDSLDEEIKLVTMELLMKLFAVPSLLRFLPRRVAVSALLPPHAAPHAGGGVGAAAAATAAAAPHVRLLDCVASLLLHPSVALRRCVLNFLSMIQTIALDIGGPPLVLDEDAQSGGVLSASLAFVDRAMSAPSFDTEHAYVPRGTRATLSKSQRCLLYTCSTHHDVYNNFNLKYKNIHTHTQNFTKTAAKRITAHNYCTPCC